MRIKYDENTNQRSWILLLELKGYWKAQGEVVSANEHMMTYDMMAYLKLTFKCNQILGRQTWVRTSKQVMKIIR